MFTRKDEFGGECEYEFVWMNMFVFLSGFRG